MSKYREDRIYEIFTDLRNNTELYKIYLLELNKIHDVESRSSDYFYKIERSYNKAIKRYESIQR